ncbi:glycosyltransferase family 2 protein [Echinicola strongylocentroti]|uniref:Glycosyltransferase family 2 protein n=1 Tax=Echinicola strongylocentroti TaxID=1795355 RepID=A0A2Z4INB6_9BACT|nr:glycosyltransferase family 2 protein [Echinicola strongylocentroti]AWW32247.1 glycosyltransferase family 2 protein [Echinicola strongylocentroti]
MTNSTKKVSIIIPTYNYGHYIGETIENLKNQSYSVWEAIIVDDGSTDNTEKIVKKSTVGDHRFIYIKIKNKGNAGARNIGLDNASGHFIQFLDADDLLSKDKLHSQLSFQNSLSKSSISYTESYYFNHNDQSKFFPDFFMKGEKWMPNYNNFAYELLDKVLVSNFAVISSPLIPRCFIEKHCIRFNERLNSKVDWLFWIRCLLSGASLHCYIDPKAYALVRRHHQSITINKTTLKYGEVTFRSVLNKTLLDSNISGNLKAKLLKLNSHLKKQLLLNIISDTKIHDYSELRECLSQLGLWTFLNYKLKLLNIRRKSFFS